MRVLLDTHALYWYIEGDLALNKYAFAVMRVLTTHTARLIGMPFHHKDPFDRLLASQALVENITIISDDAVLDAYGVRRLW